MAEHPFDARTFATFPEDWLRRAPGARMTSALIRVEPMPDDATIRARLKDWFVAESMAVSRILDDAAITASDFRIDPAGHSFGECGATLALLPTEARKARA